MDLEKDGVDGERVKRLGWVLRVGFTVFGEYLQNGGF